MKKITAILMIILVLSAVFTVTAFAKQAPPIGTCTPGFTQMAVMNPPSDMMHMHIGAQQDLNGNGYICMQMVTPDYCLIVDDVLP
jgi:hypothetical protein